MKLRSISLTNVRRFAGATVRLDGLGDGLNIVAAPNEAGKSTAFEALQALRGVSAVHAVRIVAELGDLSRFEHPRSLMGYLGLIPSEDSSGVRRRQGSITKAGNGHARWVLVQAAWQLVQRSPKWGLIYTRLEQRVGRRKAIIAVTRRLLCVAHSLLQRQEDYREYLVTPVPSVTRRRTSRTRPVTAEAKM